MAPGSSEGGMATPRSESVATSASESRSAGPKIPLRTTSKGGVRKNLKREARDDLIRDRFVIQGELRDSRKKLKAHASFDADYWVRRTDFAQKEIAHTRIQRKISIHDFMQTNDGTEHDWLKTPEAHQLFEEEKTYLSDRRVCKKQAEKLRILPGEKLRNMRRTFMQLFTTSVSGLGINTGMGRRDPSIQSTFRSDLIRASDASHPDPSQNKLWCPVISEWIFTEDSTAAHLFSYKHGQQMMDAIFGRKKGDEPELFSPRNGILMATRAESKFDKGFFAIVPLVGDNPSQSETEEWHASDPKRYKIRVINPKGYLMDTPISHLSERTWNDLDGEEVNFRNDFRPRARYLYFVYCCTMLRHSWANQNKALKGELGRRYWGTQGRFMRKNLLLAFVEEMGHEYEAVLEGAIEDEGSEDKDPLETALAAGNAEIRYSWERKEGSPESFDSNSGEDELS